MKLRWDDKKNRIVCPECGVDIKSMTYYFRTVGDWERWLERSVESNRGICVSVEGADCGDGVIKCECGAQFEGIKEDWDLVYDTFGVIVPSSIVTGLPEELSE